MSAPNPKRMKVEEEEEDFFSRFPDDILHRIMSLLSPRDVARTSVLSTSWYSTWKSFPEFALDQATWKAAVFREGMRRIFSSPYHTVVAYFLTSVDNFIRRRGEGVENRTIKKFHLFLSDFMFRMQHRHFQRAIAQVLDGGVQDFSLHYQYIDNHQLYGIEYNPRYVLPQSIFAAINSSKTLELSGCVFPELKNPSRTRFGSCLRQLQLMDVSISDEALRILSSNCRNLEELAIVCCIGFTTLNAAGLVKLRQLDLCITYYDNPLNPDLFISSPSLPSLALHSRSCRTDLQKHVSFENLKSLSLHGSAGYMFSLSDLKLAHLENLEFVQCISASVIDIRSQSVRSLSFANSVLNEIRIEAQLLDYFKYDGLFSEKIIWIKASDDLKIDLSMSYSGDFSSLTCFNKVAQILGNLSSCKILTITTTDDSGPVDMTSDERKTILLSCQIEQMKMKMVGCSSTFSIASIVEGFLQISNRPRTISIQVENENPIFLKVEFGYSEGCDRDFRSGSWRCRLTDAVVAGNSDAVVRKDGAEVGMFLMANCSCLKKIRFSSLEGKLTFLNQQ